MNDLAGKKVYIAGKITNLPAYKEKFAAVEKKLRDMGAIVMNPAILPAGFGYNEYMYICFAMIDVCEAMLFLDNWTESEGAMKEFHYGTTKRKEIFYEEDLAA